MSGGVERALTMRLVMSGSAPEGKDMPNNPPSQGALKGHTRSAQYLLGSFLDLGDSQPHWDKSRLHAITRSARGKEAKQGRI
jgi:hypothetical protein